MTSSSPLPWYGRAALHLTLLALLGCGGSPAADAIDPALLEPLSALGECPDPPRAAEGADVPGLVLPDGSVMTDVTVTDPVTTVQGWIPLTPIQIRVHYAERQDVEVLSVEDEGWEAEVLVTDGTDRLFLKARAACADASLFVAVVAPESAAAAVPTPAGTPGPAPTGG